MVELKQVTAKSKKTGRDFTAYVLQVGDFTSPMFFPSKIELNYLKDYLASEGDD